MTEKHTMHPDPITDGIHRLSANIRDILFEGLWPIPNGVAMNSYIVQGEKTAIIDGVCGWDGVPETLFTQLEAMNIRPDSIDYVIINHMEPDHSGWLEDLKNVINDFTVITSKKAVPLLKAFYDIEPNIRIVGTGDTLDLGNGRVLEFVEIPNVHWPETMATFDTKSSTLFSCDAFGSFGEIGEAAFDDTLSDTELKTLEKETQRYYANIVSTFSHSVRLALKKCAPLPIRIIAPGHGIVWRKNPQTIIDQYDRLSSWSKGPAREEITLIWGSMYGMTETAVAAVREQLQQSGLTSHIHRVPQSDIGDILADCWSSSGIILGMPTYEYKMFPPMAAVLDELGKKKVLNRKLFRFGSYGWSGGAQKELDEILARNRMNWEALEPVEFNGKPATEDFVLLKKRTEELAATVRTWCSRSE